MRRNLIWIASIVTMVCATLFALYWPGLHGGFFFDDWGSILQTEGVRLEVLSWESIYAALRGGGASPWGRPVAQLSFALNYYLSGFNPYVFKATNLAIHLSCGFLVFSLARKLLSAAMTNAKSQHILFASGLVSALWLVHPLQLLPVLHVVQRMTSLSAFFLLAALLLHIYGRESTGLLSIGMLLVAWGAAWPLAVLSKETGLLFPLFVLSWELILRRTSLGRLDRLAHWIFAICGVLTLLGVAYASSPFSHWIWSGYGFRSFSMTERMLTEARVMWLYLEMILVPDIASFGLYHDDIQIASDLFNPLTTTPAIVGLLGLVWLSWRTRTLVPLLSFGISWFLIGHLLESTVLPLEIAHEHRNYVPLFGILLVVGWSFVGVLQSGGAYRKLGISLVIGLSASLVLVTALRVQQFSKSVLRTQYEVQHHPKSSRAQHEAGRVLSEQSDAVNPSSTTFTLAREHYQRACSLDLSAKMCLLGLIQLNCQAGIPVESVWITDLSNRLRQTIFSPGDRNVLYSVKEMAITGPMCLARPEVDGLFAAAINNPRTSNTVRAIMHSWHADYLWLTQHDLTAARRALGQSLALNSTIQSNRLKWAQLLYISGEQLQAKRLLLELTGENFSSVERETLTELLAAINIAHQ